MAKSFRKSPTIWVKLSPCIATFSQYIGICVYIVSISMHFTDAIVHTCTTDTYVQTNMYSHSQSFGQCYCFPQSWYMLCISLTVSVYTLQLCVLTSPFTVLSPILVKVKVKWSRYRPGVVQRVGTRRGTRRGWVVSSTLRPHFTPRKVPVPVVPEAAVVNV